jgi:4'-phosphopantetheinyl transferase EntD
MAVIRAPAIESPAQLSEQLASLFPPGAVVAELRSPAPRSLLTSVELQSVSHCADKRINDFAAGRVCARRALEEFGVAGFSLLSGPNRQPLWPASFVGSITHTTGYCAAVVAREHDLAGLGVDCERVDAVTEDVWSGICAPFELALLRQLDRAAAVARAALIFAAKEAFYKYQYPLTHAWVGFEDVVIEAEEATALTGAFRVVPLRTLEVDPGRIAQLVGRYCFFEQWVVTGIAGLK